MNRAWTFESNYTQLGSNPLYNSTITSTQLSQLNSTFLTFCLSFSHLFLCVYRHEIIQLSTSLFVRFFRHFFFWKACHVGLSGPLPPWLKVAMRHLRTLRAPAEPVLLGEHRATCASGVVSGWVTAINDGRAETKCSLFWIVFVTSCGDPDKTVSPTALEGVLSDTMDSGS